MEKRDIEFWENEYLNQIEYLLNLDKEKMIEGFNSKEQIKDDWKQHLGKETSEFAVGAERIFYWIFNQFGQPNSSPIGSDLFFETYNAYIHIDVKTVTLSNIGDYRNIFIGNNQVSYSAEICTKSGRKERYHPHLPVKYTKREVDKVTQKICLTYFITILYDERNLSIIDLSVRSCPNGLLEETYKDIYKAGKNPGKARLNLEKSNIFKELNNESRIRNIIRIPFNEINHEKVSEKTYKRSVESIR